MACQMPGTDGCQMASMRHHTEPPEPAVPGSWSFLMEANELSRLCLRPSTQSLRHELGDRLGRGDRGWRHTAGASAVLREGTHS
jgi:hypothetical protein